MAVDSHPTAQAFAQAVRARDLSAVGPLFAADAELYSPVTEEPVVGRANLEVLFAFLNAILQDVEVTTEIAAPGQFVFGFKATVGGVPIQALDLLGFDDEGKITTFVVHTRPLAGTHALADVIAPGRSDFRP
jgi:hypothetical protein